MMREKPITVSVSSKKTKLGAKSLEYQLRSIYDLKENNLSKVRPEFDALVNAQHEMNMLHGNFGGANVTVNMVLKLARRFGNDFLLHEANERREYFSKLRAEQRTLRVYEDSSSTNSKISQRFIEVNTLLDCCSQFIL